MNQEELKALLDYDPETGVFTRKNGERVGKVGRKGNIFYRRIYVKGVRHYEHRLAWLYMTGAWPSSDRLDHINRDGTDNRWANLRPASIKENTRNGKAWGESKWRGVFWAGHKWRARIKVDRRTIHLGYFKEESDAALAYNFAALEHFGEFAAFNTV